MTVKRSRSDEKFSSDYDHQVETTEAAANCLMLLSRVGNTSTIDTALASSDSDFSDAAPSPSSSGRVFECKTCNKKFHSFQALGGHRASHKKLKLVAELLTQPSAPPPPKPAKKHGCPICGLEFPLGQALGGHMRRHRAQLLDNQTRNNNIETPPSQAAVLKRSNSGKRVFGLDLNLTPFENDFKQGSTLLVHCFI